MHASDAGRAVIALDQQLDDEYIRVVNERMAHGKARLRKMQLPPAVIAEIEREFDQAAAAFALGLRRLS